MFLPVLLLIKFCSFSHSLLLLLLFLCDRRRLFFVVWPETQWYPKARIAQRINRSEPSSSSLSCRNRFFLSSASACISVEPSTSLSSHSLRLYICVCLDLYRGREPAYKHLHKHKRVLDNSASEADAAFPSINTSFQVGRCLSSRLNQRFNFLFVFAGVVVSMKSKQKAACWSSWWSTRSGLISRWRIHFLFSASQLTVIGIGTTTSDRNRPYSADTVAPISHNWINLRYKFTDTTQQGCHYTIVWTQHLKSDF